MKNINENMNDLILSISFCYHDSCITIGSRKNILLHIEAERLFRNKHMRFKTIEEVDRAINYALEYLNISIDNINEVLITKWNNLYDTAEVTILGKKFTPIITNHHENHIGTCYPSNFTKCVILCSDGGSEDGTTKLYYKDGNNITFIEDLNDEPFTGKFYGTITQMVIEPKCSKAHNTAAGKLMGLSSLGKYNQEVYNLLCENWREINKLYFDGCEHLLKIFNISDDYSRPWLDDRRKDIAYTAHNFWVDKCYDYLKKHSQFSKNICLVGGCALNISLNSKLIDEKIYDNVYVSPISTDAGQSLGAILFRYPDISCNYPYLGRGKEFDCFDEEKYIIETLIEGKIIAWFQGRSEIGARALGHRSFLGIPTSIEMRDKLSINIKKREPYRPVAAIIPEEFVRDFFEQSYSSPFMTFCSKARMNTIEKAPAIVHYDGTTRVQTLKKEDNPLLHSILLKLKDQIGIPILMNTSFNINGEPIVDSPEDAIRTFINSGADELFINGKRYIG